MPFLSLNMLIPLTQVFLNKFQKTSKYFTFQGKKIVMP